MGTTRQRLTLFDLDNTLLGGDSDYGWAQFLIEVGALDAADATRSATPRSSPTTRPDGSISTRSWIFSCGRWPSTSRHRLFAWRERFLVEKIRPMLLPAAEAVVRQRLERG